MSSFLTYFPGKILETVKDGVIAIESAHITPAGGTTNNVVVTGVSGKRAVLTAYSLCSSGAATYAWFKSGNTRSLQFVAIPDIAVAALGNPNVSRDFLEFGFIVADVGQNLTVDVGAVRPDISYNYFLYTP